MKTILSAILLCATALPAAAEWTLDGDRSVLGFVSVKNGETAEAHSFSDLTGAVSDAGAASVTIPLASVETFIDIRNERMRDMLFKVMDSPEATVTAQVDLAAFDAMAAGDRSQQEIEVTIETNGTEASYFADILVTRLDDDTVAVGTSRPLIADARDMGYMDGIAALQEVAGLDAISPAVPVTFDLVYTR